MLTQCTFNPRKESFFLKDIFSKKIDDNEDYEIFIERCKQENCNLDEIFIIVNSEHCAKFSPCSPIVTYKFVSICIEKEREDNLAIIRISLPLQKGQYFTLHVSKEIFDSIKISEEISSPLESHLIIWNKNKNDPYIS